MLSNAQSGVSLNNTMLEIIATVVSSAALGMAGWAVSQVMKVPSIDEKLNHLVERVDALYDHLIDRP